MRAGLAAASPEPPPPGPPPQGRRSSLDTLPLEVLEAVVSCHRRGDLATLASCAAAARGCDSVCAPLLKRVVACRGCGAPLLHPRELQRAQAAPRGRIFEDGPGLALAAWPPMGQSSLRTVDVAAPEQRGSLRLLRWLLTAAGGPLGRCPDEAEVQQLLPAQEGEGREERQLASSGDNAVWRGLALQRLRCDVCGLYLGERLALSEAVPSEGGEAGRPPGGIGNGQCAVLCATYLQELDDEGPCRDLPTPLRCAGARRRRGQPGPCGQVLCDGGAVLSKLHCWCPPDGVMQDAWYVNGFVADSVAYGPARRRQLAQGLMEVSDASCTVCGGIVGWRFERDLDSAQRNRHQVGRCGLCTSSILELQGGHHQPPRFLATQLQDVDEMSEASLSDHDMLEPEEAMRADL